MWDERIQVGRGRTDSLTADELSDPQAWLTADGRGLVAALRRPAGGRIKGRAQWCVWVSVCLCVCVCGVGWITSVCICKCLHTHTQTLVHPWHQLHLSLTWESLMTEVENPKKKAHSFSLSLSLPLLSFPPSLSLLTALSNINAPYGAPSLDRLFKTHRGLAHNQFDIQTHTHSHTNSTY